MLYRFLVLAAFIASFGLNSGCTLGKNSDVRNTLNLPVIVKLKTLDPALCSDIYCTREAGYVYEGLIGYHYLKRPYELIPRLAESLPTISKDRKVYLFKITPGILFQDDPCFKVTKGKGRELVAEDFVYSIKRIADSKNLSPGWWVFDGKVVGLNEWREAGIQSGATDYSLPIAGLKALDRYTLRIELKAPSEQFLYGLATQYGFVIPREAVEYYDKDLGRNPVGTGPYRLVRWVQNWCGKKILRFGTSSIPAKEVRVTGKAACWNLQARNCP